MFVRYLIERLDYVDGQRVAVWGHGYGGHVATRLLAEDKDKQIVCGIAVAPVAKWQNYGLCLAYSDIASLPDTA